MMSNWHHATSKGELAYADVTLTEAVVNHYGSPIRAAWERAQVVLRELSDVEWEQDQIGEVVERRNEADGTRVYRVYAHPLLSRNLD
jgi:hypothetical protein